MSTQRRLSGRYDLGEILGFGGMAEVHLARDVRLHRDVAVKLLRADLARDPDCYLRFRREAQHAAALNHPAIVAVFDTGITETATGPLPYIVMEYVDGVTLRDIVHNDGPIEPRRAIEIVADVCQALNFSHRHGTIHRDVKPANIMISTAGAVKVMDFGIARTLTDSGKRLTETAAVLGTAHYLSPEQARGEDVDARSDVYSLACVLYEILTGEAPFVGESPLAIAYQHVRADPVPPSQRHSGISPELDAVVLNGLAKNPDNRYQSAAEMRADLIHVHSGQTPQAPKVLIDAEFVPRASTPPLGGDSGQTAQIDPQHSASTPRSKGGRSVRRWLVPAATVATLIAAATFAIHAVGTATAAKASRYPMFTAKPSRTPSRHCKTLVLKSAGRSPKPDPTLAAGRVIDTVPGAHTALAGGDAITVNVSSGPEQHEVPNCVKLTVDACIRTLAEAGFKHVEQSPLPSATVPPNEVIATVPGAGRLSVLADDITVEVSTGPESRRVPDVTGQTVDEATKNLTDAGFPIILRGSVDSIAPIGHVVSTDPPAGVNLSVRSAIMVKVSRGDEFLMPNLIGMTYDEIVPYLRSLGHVGPLLNAGDLPGTDADRNRALQQTPAPGTGINRDGTITLHFGS